MTDNLLKQSTPPYKQPSRSLADHSNVATPWALVFIMDLFRPAPPSAAQNILEQYCSTEPQILKEDFHHSLLAAYRIDEVSQQLDKHGLNLECRQVSDRHLATWERI